MCDDFNFIRLKDNVNCSEKGEIMKCIISEHIYIYHLHIRDYAVCSYWVIRCYPGAVFHPGCT